MRALLVLGFLQCLILSLFSQEVRMGLPEEHDESVFLAEFNKSGT